MLIKLIKQFGIGCLLLLLPLWAVQAEETATLNLKDADIRVLIDTVSEITGKNFIIDPRVKAKVTVISANPMRANELYQVFLSILQVHGFAAVETADVTKIVPDVNAKQGPVPTVSTRSPGRGDQLVTRVIQVNNVPAAQLVPILRPLIPQQGQLAAYQPSNILLVSDRAANVRRLVEIIKRIDRPDQDDIEVIRLQSAPASEVARTLTTLQRKDSKGGAMPGQPVITADDRTNSILISGDKATRLRLRGIIAHLDTPLDSGGDTQVIFLKYAQAEEMVQILTGVSKSNNSSNTKRRSTARKGSKIAKRATALGSKKDVSIQADKTNNALIITAPPSTQQALRQVISQLDIRRAQVLIEAVIAEVSLDLSKELGTSFALQGGRKTGPAIVTNLGGLASTVLGVASGTSTSIPTGAFLGGGDFRDGRTNFGLLVKALASDAATNILSTPTLVTLDNVEAEIKVGQEVPFLTGQFSNTGSSNGSVNPFQTIERKDVGLTLNVKPQINEGDAIQLDIVQESSTLASTSVSTADVVTNKRTIKTSVLANDGQVIVLGGLSDDNFRDSQEKVPLLGDIPFLGNLFKFSSTKKVKQTLMVFIHPVILRDTETANAYTNSKYSYFRARQLDAGIQDRGLINDSAAVIPDLDKLLTQLPGEAP
ncbi:MAG TPA: type II secretion system protein GspD, partial [Gammaproteobacteria bacterium]|nr:type II secretion system protein GspD [Gammaproteobacteria bacterium]